MPQVIKLESGRAALNPASEAPEPQTLVPTCPFFLLPTQTAHTQLLQLGSLRRHRVSSRFLTVLSLEAYTTTRSLMSEPGISPASWMSAKASHTLSKWGGRGRLFIQTYKCHQEDSHPKAFSCFPGGLTGELGDPCVAGEWATCRIYQLWVRLGVWRDLLQLVAGKLGILINDINNRKKGCSYHHF